MMAHEQIGLQRTRPVTKPGDRFHCTVGQAKHDRRNAGEIHQIGLQHAERDTGGAAGVDRVAAAFEDREPSHGGKIVTGGDGMARAANGGTMRCHRVSPLLLRATYRERCHHSILSGCELCNSGSC